MIFRRLFFHVNTQKEENEHIQIYRNELKQTKEDLELALHNLNNVTDPDLIDCCIYEAQAAQLRYKVLLRDVKQYEAMHFLDKPYQHC